MSRGARSWLRTGLSLALLSPLFASPLVSCYQGLASLAPFPCAGGDGGTTGLVCPSGFVCDEISEECVVCPGGDGGLGTCPTIDGGSSPIVGEWSDGTSYDLFFNADGTWGQVSSDAESRYCDVEGSFTLVGDSLTETFASEADEPVADQNQPNYTVMFSADNEVLTTTHNNCGVCAGSQTLTYTRVSSTGCTMLDAGSDSGAHETKDAGAPSSCEETGCGDGEECSFTGEEYECVPVDDAGLDSTVPSASPIVGEWSVETDGGTLTIFFDANGSCGLFESSLTECISECSYTVSGDELISTIDGSESTTNIYFDPDGTLQIVGACDAGECTAVYTRVNSSPADTCP